MEVGATEKCRGDYNVGLVLMDLIITKVNNSERFITDTGCVALRTIFDGFYALSVFAITPRASIILSASFNPDGQHPMQPLLGETRSQFSRFVAVHATNDGLSYWMRIAHVSNTVALQNTNSKTKIIFWVNFLYSRKNILFCLSIVLSILYLTFMTSLQICMNLILD